MLDKNRTREIVEKLVSYTGNYAVVNIYDNGERLSKFANSQIVHNVETEDVLVVVLPPSVVPGTKLVKIC